MIVGRDNRGVEHDRCMLELRVLLDPLGEMEAVHLRHFHVGYDKIGHLIGASGLDQPLFHSLPGLGPVFVKDQLRISARPQRRADRLADGG